MTIEKSELRAQAFHEAGVAIDDLLEGTEKDLLRTEGALVALAGVSKNIETLKGNVGRELDATEAFSIETADLIKQSLNRAGNTCLEPLAKLKEVRQQLTGRANTLRQVIKVIKNLHDSEIRKTKRDRQELVKEEAPKKEAASGQPEERSTRRRPGPTLKQQRNAKGEKEEIQSTELGKEEQNVADITKEIAEVEEARRNAMERSKRKDERFQCGDCKRHFGTWEELMVHCAEESHTPRGG